MKKILASLLSLVMLSSSVAIYCSADESLKSTAGASTNGDEFIEDAGVAENSDPGPDQQPEDESGQPPEYNPEQPQEEPLDESGQQPEEEPAQQLESGSDLGKVTGDDLNETTPLNVTDPNATDAGNGTETNTESQKAKLIDILAKFFNVSREKLVSFYAVHPKSIVVTGVVAMVGTTAYIFRNEIKKFTKKSVNAVKNIFKTKKATANIA